ncbi:MAG: sulfurtransferase [Tumebacillaceae bacterium]
MQTHVVSLEWVAEHLNDPQVKLVDCRFVLGQPDAGSTAYAAGHLPGAVYFDLEKDLSAPKSAHGGRHPLPDIAAFAEKLGQAGIDQTSTVVAYDDQGGAMASRFWWLMQYVGHSSTVLMDGTFSQWQAQGQPVTTEVPHAEQVTFAPHVQEHLVVHVEDVKQRLGKAGTVLIDSREGKRYAGLEEAIDPVAGHIPGAVNHFWMEGLTADKTWKSAVEQKARFEDVNPADEVIVYCGSGVTACPNILALKQAGYENVKLYAGSWSDWCSYPDNPIATKKAD